MPNSSGRRARLPGSLLIHRATRTFQQTLAIGALFLVFIACGGSSPSTGEREQAIAAAQQIYSQVKASGTDLSHGPCIAEQLQGLPDWSVDVAHNPRQPVDDQPANQCAFFRQGKTHHFVELDPDGKLIRAQ